jgi:selenide,water dikinase
MGHLCEICEGSGLKADIWFDKIPLLPGVLDYIQLGCIPGGTRRNYDSYGQKIAPLTEIQKAIVCDPQTSGGLLLAVSAQSQETVENIARKHNIELQAIGELSEEDGGVLIEVH